VIGRLHRVVGPGLFLAAMAIGVSHVVQSTRAGADFGFQLVGLVIAVNLAKYPFFEYGHRYAAATGESLLHGYRRLGRAAIVAYLILHVFISIVGTAAIVFVTAAFAQNLFGVGPGPTIMSAALIAACIALIIAGKFRGLDLVIKLMVVLLVLTTATTLAAAIWHGPVAAGDFHGPSPWRVAHLGFLIALMGWMPSPIDVSIFQSLWLVARDKATGRRTTLAEARFDFNLGYGLTLAGAVVFLALGALVMYGSGTVFASSNLEFASQFVGLYSSTLGGWFRPVIAVIALLAMLTTTLTVIDASPRSLAVAQGLLTTNGPTRDGARLHALWMIGIGLAALVLIFAFRSRFVQLIDLATTISFLVAPAFAYLNMRVLASDRVPVDARPGPLLRLMAVLGLLFLIGFGLLYVGWRLSWIGC